jgi:hypothetical protein
VAFASAIDWALRRREDPEWLERVDATLADTSWDWTWERMDALLDAALRTVPRAPRSGNDLARAVGTEKVA